MIIETSGQDERAAGGGAAPGAAWPARWSASLSGIGEVLAVVAHPDDESFGLGRLLSAWTGSGRRVRVLCLTRREASTLGASADLGRVCSAELRTTPPRRLVTAHQAPQRTGG